MPKSNAIRVRAVITAGLLIWIPATLRGASALRTQEAKQPVALRRVLAHMDEAAGQVKTISAQLAYTTVTVLVNDRSTQTGQLFFRRGKRLEMAIRFVKPDLKVILFKHNKAEIFNPKTSQIQEYDLERQANLVQQFLLLGFGTPVSELEDSYRFKYLGEQRLDDQNTQALELTPIQKDISAHLTRVELWVSETSWLPVQQQFFEPSGDYLIATYSNVRVNQRLGRADFEIHAPTGVERVKMN